MSSNAHMAPLQAHSQRKYTQSVKSKGSVPKTEMLKGYKPKAKILHEYQVRRLNSQDK